MLQREWRQKGCDGHIKGGMPSSIPILYQYVSWSSTAMIRCKTTAFLHPHHLVGTTTEFKHQVSQMVLARYHITPSRTSGSVIAEPIKCSVKRSGDVIYPQLRYIGSGHETRGGGGCPDPPPPPFLYEQ